MLACLGFVVQEIYTFGGTYFPKMLSVEAHDFYMKTGGMSQMLLFIAAFESLSYFKIKQMLEGKSEPGDYSFDPLGKWKGALEQSSLGLVLSLFAIRSRQGPEHVEDLPDERAEERQIGHARDRRYDPRGVGDQDWRDRFAPALQAQHGRPLSAPARAY